MTDLWEFLDYGLVADIGKSKARYEELLQFHWEYYSELAFRRNRIYDSLKQALADKAGLYEFSKWQRAVKYRYSLSPLHTGGSLSDPGGRFNIGEIDQSRFPIFPALYVASDKWTALAEILGSDSAGNPLTAQELALTRSDSVSVVSISGKLESVLDTRDTNSLAGFVSLIKDFRLSSALTSKARRLGLAPQLIRTVERLKKELLAQNWRMWPMQLDVPAPSQIFGRIIVDAGIEGILYPSVLTQKLCFAIFPQNFQASPSFVELDDPPPNDNVPRRIDAMSFKNFI